MTRRGRYVALDGADGCGKSTQARLLVDDLRRAGHAVEHVREPGSTVVGEDLRRLLLDPETPDLDAWTEALLFTAARRELVRRQIAPALANGTWIVSERCFASTVVYQGWAPVAGDAADAGLLTTMNAAVHELAAIDLLVVLTVSPERAAERMAAGRDGADRIEQRGLEFQRRVADAFGSLRATDLHGAVRQLTHVDADGDVADVARAVRAEVDVMAGSPAGEERA